MLIKEHFCTVFIFNCFLFLLGQLHSRLGQQHSILGQRDPVLGQWDPLFINSSGGNILTVVYACTEVRLMYSHERMQFLR